MSIWRHQSSHFWGLRLGSCWRYASSRTQSN